MEKTILARKLLCQSIFDAEVGIDAETFVLRYNIFFLSVKGNHKVGAILLNDFRYLVALADQKS